MINELIRNHIFRDGIADFVFGFLTDVIINVYDIRVANVRACQNDKTL